MKIALERKKNAKKAEMSLLFCVFRAVLEFFVLDFENSWKIKVGFSTLSFGSE
jgi:hypothetical protein